jgi:hypothetical protein
VANPHNLKNKGFDKHPEHINKNGRPRRLPELDVILADVLSDISKDGLDAATEVIKALYKQALKGNVRASEILLDRAYGKVKQTIDHQNNGKDFDNISDHDIVNKLTEFAKAIGGTKD